MPKPTQSSVSAAFEMPTADSAGAIMARAAERVSQDLNIYLEQGENPKRRLKHMAKRIEIHEKTLSRICNRENKPTYATVFKIYRFLLGEEDDAKLLERLPEEVSEFVRRANPQTLERGATYSCDLDREIRTNPILGEIYILCATGPVKLSQIRARFGEYGLKVVERLVAKEALEYFGRGEICQGRAQVNMSPETTAGVARHLLQEHLKPENCYETGNNYMGFYAEGLNDETLQKWLAIDAEATAKKVALARDPANHGSLRVFTFGATELMNIETFETKAALQNTNVQNANLPVKENT